MAAKKTKTEVKKIVAAPPEEKIKVNKAKAAFDEYRKKMEASKMAAPRIESRSAAPFASPSFHGMPFMPHEAHQAGMPPYLPHQAIPSPAIMIPRGSLFEGIGSMLRLGVDVMNAGLAGGLQLMEGFSHHESGCCQPHHETSCCDHSPTYHGHSDRCCNTSCCSTSCDCCCNPGVNNCC